MRLLARLALVVVALAAAPAVAQDRFEIQVYDAETARPLRPGLELHLNTFTQGSTVASNAGEAATQHLWHFTLEPHLGVTSWWEVGAYVQFALLADGSFDWAGAKLRTKLRWPRRLANGVIGLAINFELSYVPSLFEANVWGSEIRPVFEIKWRRLYFSLNPIIDTDLGGVWRYRPQLQPAAKLTVAVAAIADVGLEYYAGLGPLDALLPAAQQSHRVFVVGDVELGRTALNLGVGYGALPDERWTVKAIVGRDF